MTVSATFRPALARWSLPEWLGWTMGLVMPICAAMLYPTYMHQMQPAWVEWTRLLELPFVACELVIIQVAIARGYEDRQIMARLPRDVIVAFALLLVGLTVGSVLLSRNPVGSLFLSLTTLVHLRFCAAVFSLTRASDLTVRHLELFQGLLVGGLAVLTVLTAWRFHFPPRPETVPGGQIEWGSALPGFINVRHFGSWTGAIAAASLVDLLYNANAKRSSSLFYVLAAGLTCWSGTRAAVLALGVVALIFLLSLRQWPPRRRIVAVAALSLVALTLGAFLAPDNGDFMLYASGDARDANIATGGRLLLWHATIARWLASPWFGWGSGSTFWEVYIGWWHTQPHNVVLQFLISWGIVGTAGGLWLLGRAIVATHRIGVARASLRPLTATLYALLFMSLLEGMLYYPRFIMLIATSFAILFAAVERDTVSSLD
ncbi:O-antigen ligase family protein [Sphingomonas citri]